MKEIPFSSFYQAYQKGDLHVLDVREQEEYDALHLDGVRLLPLSELADRYQEMCIRDRPWMASTDLRIRRRSNSFASLSTLWKDWILSELIGFDPFHW